VNDRAATEDLTGIELAQLLRQEFPQLDTSTFDEDVASMVAPDKSMSPPDPSRCAVLIAFSHQFNDWVRQGSGDSVRSALELVDRLLAETPPVPAGTRPGEVGDQFHNSLLACFVEGVMDTSPEFQSLVLPNLGPELRGHLETYYPHLLPPADGRN
jgi:hypothetical protein